MVVVFTLLVTSAFSPVKTKKPEKEGIDFFHGSLTEAKAKAKKENKYIFIDCFTTWCGPCKKMSKTTFMDKEVGEYYNKNFICMKIDMENGEGLKVASNYGINAYPTYLFLDHKGDVKHKDLGFIDASRFIKVGETAMATKK